MFVVQFSNGKTIQKLCTKLSGIPMNPLFGCQVFRSQLYTDYLTAGLDNVMLYPASAMKVKKHYVLPAPSLIDLVSKNKFIFMVFADATKI